jgi:hypothetical protein
MHGQMYQTVSRPINTTTFTYEIFVQAVSVLFVTYLVRSSHGTTSDNSGLMFPKAFEVPSNLVCHPFSSQDSTLMLYVPRTGPGVEKASTFALQFVLLSPGFPDPPS